MLSSKSFACTNWVIARSVSVFIDSSANAGWTFLSTCAQQVLRTLGRWYAAKYKRNATVQFINSRMLPDDTKGSTHCFLNCLACKQGSPLCRASRMTCITARVSTCEMRVFSMFALNIGHCTTTRIRASISWTCDSSRHKIDVALHCGTHVQWKPAA